MLFLGVEKLRLTDERCPKAPQGTSAKCDARVRGGGAPCQFRGRGGRAECHSRRNFPARQGAGGLGRDAAVFVFGIIFVFGLLKGVLAARDRRIAVHRAWMIRVYAIGIGATTQRLLILPVFLTTGTASDHTIAAGIWAGWIINLLIAEWIIRRKTNTQITEVAK